MLEAMPEVQKVTPLTDEQLQRLLKPWLGDDINTGDLPIPRLIDVRLKPGADVDFNILAQKLAHIAPQASLDNHKLWLNKLINFAAGLKMLALAVLLLVVCVTSGAIFYTTQTSLGLHKDVIEILHLMGAKTHILHNNMQSEQLGLAVLAGLSEWQYQYLLSFLIAHLAQQIEGGIINEANLSTGAWIIILSLPLFSSLVAMQTAYYTVKRTLERMM